MAAAARRTYRQTGGSSAYIRRILRSYVIGAAVQGSEIGGVRGDSLANSGLERGAGAGERVGDFDRLGAIGAALVARPTGGRRREVRDPVGELHDPDLARLLPDPAQRVGHLIGLRDRV